MTPARLVAAVALASAGLIGTGVLAQDGPRRPAVRLDPIPAILDAFKSHEVVALSEGPHGNTAGHAFRLALLRDPRFATLVNDIVLESGSSRYQAEVDAFIRGESVPEDVVREALENSAVATPVWDRPIFLEFFRAVRALNQTLPPERRMRVLLGDPPIDWATVKTADDYRPWLMQRDSHPAGVIQREVLARGRRALVIYGDGHLQARRERPGRSLVGILETGGARVFAITSTFADLTTFQRDVASWSAPGLALLKGTALGAVPYGHLFGPPPPVEFFKAHPNVEDHFDAVLSLGTRASMRLAPPSYPRCAEPAYIERRVGRMVATGMPPTVGERLAQECQAARPPDARVGARAEQVRVEVRVTDSRNVPVTDLQQADFEITDDDQRQAIVTFIPPGRVQASTTAAPAAPPASAPAAVSQEGAAPAAAGRPVVVVLDDLHVAAPNTLKVTDAVRRFIETVVSSADSVAVVVTSGAGGGQDFTADRRLVLKAVDRFRGQKLRSATVERLNDVSLNLGGVLSPNPDPLWPDRDNRARIALETLQKTADALAPLEDRRPMLLWVSEGPEYEANERTNTNQSNPWSIGRSMRAAIERLNRANAVVFAIDPRGVSAGNADQIQTSSIFESKDLGTLALQNENVRAFGLVQAVAANTGGFAMLWRPDMSADFRRVVAANESYYLIGYDAPATNRGKYHTIAVRVQRKGVQVRTRSGYILPAVSPATPAPGQ